MGFFCYYEGGCFRGNDIVILVRFQEKYTPPQLLFGEFVHWVKYGEPNKRISLRLRKTFSS